MKLRSEETVSKALLSSPSSFIGEFEMDGALLTQAWQDFGDPTATHRREDGPASRNAFMLVFATEPLVRAPGVVIPDYSYTSIIVGWYLSVLFGKRFDHHGLVESMGMYRAPTWEMVPTLCQHKLTHNSRKVRADYPVPLDLREVKRIQPLLEGEAITPEFRQAFQTAAKFYSQALQNFETDPEVAYLHLVTSIEVLSSQTDLTGMHTYDARTQHFLDRIESGLDDGPAIVKHFKGKLLSIKRKFVSAVCQLVQPDFFLTGECDELYGRFKSESFVKRISAAYDLRSNYVHTGAPFGNWVRMSSAAASADVQLGEPVTGSKKLSKVLAKAPTFSGLERVVRVCLLRSLELKGLYVALPAVPSEEPAGAEHLGATSETA